jgi:hypothetical protein
MKPPVLDVTLAAAGGALWPQNRTGLGLRGDDHLLHTRQKLLGLGQRRPQIGNVAKVAGELISITSIPWTGLSAPVSISRRAQLIHNPPVNTLRPSYRFYLHPPLAGRSRAAGAER